VKHADVVVSSVFPLLFFLSFVDSRRETEFASNRVSRVRDDRTFHRLSYGVERGEILKSKGRRAKKAAHLLVIVILELDVVRLVVHQETRVILTRRVPFIGKLRDGAPVDAPTNGDEKE